MMSLVNMLRMSSARLARESNAERMSRPPRSQRMTAQFTSFHLRNLFACRTLPVELACCPWEP
jgi:hypothetical protein